MKPTLVLCLAWLAAGPALADPDPAPAATEKPPAPAFALSIDQAVKLALQNNPDILVEKLGPEIGREGVRQASGAYDPLLTTNLLRTSVKQPGTTALAGGQTIESSRFDFNAGVSKLFATGGALQLTFQNDRSTNTSTFTSFNPLYQSDLTLSLTQPLLRNFFNDTSRLQLRVAKNNQAISDAQFAQIVVNTAAAARQQYYELLYAVDNLDAAQKSLGLAQQLLNENKIRVKVGTLAPLDVVEAQSEVAGREQGVIVAEAALADAQDALKRTIFPRDQPDLWTMALSLTDHPAAEPVSVDAGAAITRALRDRSDMAIARKNLANADVTARYASNQTRPQLDLVASYGAAGAGGTQLRDLSKGFTGDLLPVPIPGGYSDALSSVFGRDFPTWTLGVNFSYPLFNRAASGRSTVARFQRDQAEATLRRLETDVAVEVRRAARAVESNLKSVDATRAARVLQEQRLDAENKKFAAGMSTNFLVTQAQRDLATARVAELRAIADYNESLVTFGRVQQVPVEGIVVVGTPQPADTTPPPSASGGTTGGAR